MLIYLKGGNMNSVNLIGRICNKLENKVYGGIEVVKVVIAHNQYKKDKDKDTFIQKTKFFNITAFNAEAQKLMTKCNKGDLIGISGHLEQETFTTKEGKKAEKVYVIADKIFLLANNKIQKETKTNPKTEEESVVKDDEEYDDIPF